MYPFLKAIAVAYRHRYENLSDFCFVFPNKRSGTFFLKYLRSTAKESLITPEVMSISEFVCRIGDSVVDNRISSLFTLYKCYCSLLSPDSRPDFDGFRTWGETVLSDFNEVGMNCSDVDALFKNLKDHKEIATDFLTPDQRKIMEEYFGQSFSPEEEERSFWRHFNLPGDNEEEESEESTEDKTKDQFSQGKVGKKRDRDKIHLRKRFLRLWETLAPLYKLFNKSLADKGLVSSSGSYRMALDKLEKEGRGALPWDKVVMVGFNALTQVELTIFKEMADSGNMDTGPHPEDAKVDFIWDATGPIFKRLEEIDRVQKNTAARFVNANRERFPEPEWIKKDLAKSDADTLPSVMRTIGSPSNVLQAKFAAEEVVRLFRKGEQRDIRNAGVAVVLPDENLLIPFLYALPEEISEVNLTMGYSLKLTSAVTFISQLRQTLRSSRDKDGELFLYLPDLKLLLAHPIVKSITGVVNAENVIRKIEAQHQAMISSVQLKEDLPELGVLSEFPLPKTDPISVIDYIDSALALASDYLTGSNVELLKAGLDSQHIEAFREGMRPLRKIIEEAGIGMGRDTVFSLVQRLIGGLRVNFEGEPLRGLQVMGLLETRSLDFDVVIIPSLNERILPMKSRSRTFIPNSLRAAYGLPPANYAENLFAYYFFRLISRAKEVIMIYDARSGSGMRSGGVSRYIHQLRHLFAKDIIKNEERTFTLSDFTPRIESIVKSSKIDEEIKKYLVEPIDSSRGKTEEKYLSATAVNDYCKCEKYFFFKHIAKIPEVNETSLHVDHIHLGNIVHRIMEILYSPQNDEPRRIDIDYIDLLLSEKDGTIIRETTSAMVAEFPFLKKRGSLPPDFEIVRGAVVDMIKGILRIDRELAASSPGACFRVLACEKGGVDIVTTPEGREIRFRYAIDRVDTAGKGFRIVDYKTGAVHAKGRDFIEMFEENSTSMSSFLQLMAYSNIARKLWPEETEEGIEMVLYRVTEMAREIPSKDSPIVKPMFVSKDEETGKEVKRTFESDIKVSCKVDRTVEIEEGDEYREEFMFRLGEKLDTLFDSPEFRPTENESVCSTCAYAAYCLR